MTRTKLLVGILSGCVIAGTANANLITNGSFETGDLSGWSISGTQLSYFPAVVTTNGMTACCFGEAVPADTVSGGSDDPAGTHGVYFVDDRANQYLTQSVYLTAGSYDIGFDAYAPYNGYNNYGDAWFTGTIAGVTLANYSVHDQGTPGQWFNYSGLADVLSDGFYDVSFNFQTLGGASADVVIDRVYINASEDTGGTPIGPAPTVPEPATLALLGIGLIGMRAVRSRQRA